MDLVGSTPLNKFLDEHTVAELAEVIPDRLGSVGSTAITGEQRINSLKDEITVDQFVAHYKASYGGSLPAASGLLSTDKLNSTRDLQLLSHLVKYMKDDAGISIAVPVNSVAPTIAGTGTGPFNVTDTGTWSNDPDSFTYQWQADGVDINGATTDTLADGAYTGVDITCDVTAVNEAGSSAPATSNIITGA